MGGRGMGPPDPMLVSNHIFLSPGYNHPALMKLIQQPQNVVSPRVMQCSQRFRGSLGQPLEIVHPFSHSLNIY